MSVKQVIVIRTKYQDKDGNTFRLRRGKEIAQGAHASCSVLADRISERFYNGSDDPASALDEVCGAELIEWLSGGFTKITLQVDSEAELMEIFNKAQKAHLTTYLITDSGKTEFDGVPTKTCLAIGPHAAEKIDKITGHLKLY